MVSLSAAAARHRVFYPRPVAPMPDIVMIDMAADLHDAPRSLGRYHPILCETVAEHEELEACLDAAREGSFLSDPLDARASVLGAGHTTIAHYGPPIGDWPYVLLCRWPPDLTAAAPQDLKMFTRGAYTVELFDDQDQLERATERLLTLLGRLQHMTVETILPDWSAVPGAAPH